MYVLTGFDGRYSVLDTKDFATDVLTEEQLSAIMTRTGCEVIGLKKGTNNRLTLDTSRVYAKSKANPNVTTVYNVIKNNGNTYLILYPIQTMTDLGECVTIEVYDMLNEQNPYRIKQTPIGVFVSGVFKAPDGVVRVMLQKTDGSKRMVTLKSKSITFQ